MRVQNINWKFLKRTCICALFILPFAWLFNRYAFIEFQEASCVAKALQYNGAMFGGEPLK